MHHGDCWPVQPVDIWMLIVGFSKDCLNLSVSAAMCLLHRLSDRYSQFGRHGIVGPRAMKQYKMLAGNFNRIVLELFATGNVGFIVTCHLPVQALQLNVPHWDCGLNRRRKDRPDWFQQSAPSPSSTTRLTMMNNRSLCACDGLYKFIKKGTRHVCGPLAAGLAHKTHWHLAKELALPKPFQEWYKRQQNVVEHCIHSFVWWTDRCVRS